jgi:hypothetical protein
MYTAALYLMLYYNHLFYNHLSKTFEFMHLFIPCIRNRGIHINNTSTAFISSPPKALLVLIKRFVVHSL